MTFSFGQYFLLLCLLMGLGVTKATTSVPLAVRPARVVLLLHGMNSNLKTWNKLVDNNAGFDGHCANTQDAHFQTTKITPNSEGIYCTRINFGTLDRISTAPKGIDKKTCAQAGGCSGDYSRFDGLAQEIATATNRIKHKLGTNVEIILLGHSRGGLAARAFLQSTTPFKKNIVGLITTGTPHSGTPLGRYYSYLSGRCAPESDHNSILDFSSCANDWRFVNSMLIKDAARLDLKSPTIGYLSETSTALSLLNSKIAALPNIQMTQIAYNDTAFGCLGGDLIHKDSGCGYDIFGKIVQFKPSHAGLNAVLNGRNRNTLKGDGIVPFLSQKMSTLKSWKIPVKSYVKSKRVHIAETEQILDLSTALTNTYKQVGWLL